MVHLSRRFCNFKMKECDLNILSSNANFSVKPY